jgi:release factor H-coupled RctB family protein
VLGLPRAHAAVIMGNPISSRIEATPIDALRRPEPLPDQARLLALDSVWMEGEALEQLARVARMDDCVQAVGMPDLHAGPGMPIGAALGFGSTIHPHLVGSDAGCGARLVVLDKLKQHGDALERRVRATFAEPPSMFEDLDDPLALLEAVWQHGPRALVDAPIDDALAELAEAEADDDLPDSGALPSELACEEFLDALGTIGGGNHFAEVGEVTRVFDEATAASLGLERRSFALLIHTGSRGLGKMLAGLWGMQPLTDPGDQQRYLVQLAGALRFARTNRLLVAWRLLGACGAARRSKLRGTVDLMHNFVRRESMATGEGFVHRKGCASASEGELAVVLGSRGAPSWLMRGCGEKGCLCSVAHGAGRRMTRSEARAKLGDKHKRATLSRTACGSRVICDDKDLLYEEHPDAYKPIDPVIASLEAAGAATRVAELAPVLTVKA